MGAVTINEDASVSLICWSKPFSAEQRGKKRVFFRKNGVQTDVVDLPSNVEFYFIVLFSLNFLCLGDFHLPFNSLGFQTILNLRFQFFGLPMLNLCVFQILADLFDNFDCCCGDFFRHAC